MERFDSTRRLVGASALGFAVAYAGLAFGWATIRAGVLPRWSAISLMAGAGMGAALLAPAVARTRLA